LLSYASALSIARQTWTLEMQTLAALVDARYAYGVADRSELASPRTTVLVLRNALPTLVVWPATERKRHCIGA